MANKTIDEIKAEAAVVRDATEEGENTAMRVGTVMIDMIDTLSESVSINAIKGYVVIDSTSELPEEPTPEQQKGYLLDTTLYVYVGEGGDTLDGLYQSAELQGPAGATGPAGADGHDGVSLGEVALVNNLIEGGEQSALTAEMGKALGQRTEYPMDKVVPSISGTINTNGGDWAIGGYWRTPYTIIDPTKPVYAVGDSNNNSVAFVAFYNNKKQFISCVKKVGAAGVEYEIQVPEGATLARSTCTTAQKATAYLTQKVQHKINEVVIKHNEDIESEINLLKGATQYLGYLVNGVVTGATFRTTDFVRIEDTLRLVFDVEGMQYNSGIDVLAFYTDRDDSTYLGGITTSASGNFAIKDVLTIPAGAKWVRVCGPAGYIDSKMALLCAKNDFNNVVLEEIVKTPSIIAPLQKATFLLPSFIDVAVGRQCDFFVGDYIDNPSCLPFRYSYGNDIVDYGRGHLRITGTSAGTTDLVLTTKITADAKTFLYNDGAVGTHTIKIRKVAKSGGSGTFNVLIVGDSLVQYGPNPSETYRLLNEDGDVTINQIGTETQSLDGVTYRHEGHGGWTWAKFNSGSDSPFVFNGQLSFAQYMATNFPTLSGIDFCIVMLGTNDAESVVLNGAKTFVNALLADYPNCKIAIGVPAFGRPCEGMPTAMERKLRYESYVYLKTFDNGAYNANVTCIGHGCWIDRVNDYQHEESDSTPYSSDKFIHYTDGVHPRTQGYKQWGRAVYCKIRAWIAGNL